MPWPQPERGRSKCLQQLELIKIILVSTGEEINSRLYGDVIIKEEHLKVDEKENF